MYYGVHLLGLVDSVDSVVSASFASYEYIYLMLLFIGNLH